MLRRVLLFSALVVGAAAFPLYSDQILPKLPAFTQSEEAEAPAQPEVVASLELPAEKPLASGQVRLKSDDRGHFNGEFRLNGKKVHAMVDTGASVVAINRSTARQLGIILTSESFSHSVNTANGNIRAAPVMLSTVEIGRIRVRDVSAVVLDDAALSGTLIGMSFLRALKRYEVKNQTLLLSQ